MEIAKKHFYDWIMVLLLNIGAFFIFKPTLIDRIPTVNFGAPDSVTTVFNPTGIQFWLCLLVSIIPLLIVRSNKLSKNRFGYGIPAVMFISTVLLFLFAFTCEGKYCEIIPGLIGIHLGLSAIIFFIFYTIGLSSPNWSKKTFFLSIGIELFFILIIFFWIATSGMNPSFNF